MDAVRTVLGSARTGHRPLYVFAVSMALLSVALLIAASIDPRTVLGAEVWIKPLKFAVSFTLYAGALSWLLSRLPAPRRSVRVAADAIVAASVIEMLIITGQAARGVRSHFNDDGALNIALFAVMGLTITVLYLAAVIISVAVLRQSGPDRVVTAAVKAGLVVTLLGFAVGVVMVLHNAHTVGAPDGGPGLPFVGWSTTAGDLRIGHFIGIHALQILPLAAAGLMAIGRDRWSTDQQVRLVQLVAATYTAVVVLVTWQALRAQPLLRTDALTLAVGLLVVVALAVGVARTVRLRRPVTA